jgi:hypothetical protein
MEDPLAVATEQTERTIIYFNGFTIGVGNADFAITLRLENAERVSLKCSYTVAKTLAEKLTIIVGQFEKATEHNLMTTEQVGEALKVIEKQRAEQSKAKSEDEPKLAK